MDSHIYEAPASNQTQKTKTDFQIDEVACFGPQS